MKTSPGFVLRFLLVVLAAFFAIMPRGFASAEEQVDQALAASKSWVAQIDLGQYEQSYDFTCGALRDRVPEDRWIEVLKAVREPWGPAVQRKQTSHIYKPNGVTNLPGECMVITYDTSFKKMDSATEEVVLKWEGGKWRGAGYHAAPKASGDNAAPTPGSDTETHTEPHVQPQPR